MRIFCSAIGVSLFMSGAVLADTNSDCGQDANAVLASRAAPRSSNKPGVATQSLFNARHQCLCGARFRLFPRPSQISVKRSR